MRENITKPVSIDEKINAAMKNISVPDEIIIYYSKSMAILKMIGGIVLIVGSIWAYLSIEPSPVLDSLFVLFSLVVISGVFIVYKMYKELKNTEPQITINSKGIQTAGNEFSKWDEVIGEEVIDVYPNGQGVKHELVYNCKDKDINFRLDDLDVSVEQLKLYLKLYREKSRKYIETTQAHPIEKTEQCITKEAIDTDRSVPDEKIVHYSNNTAKRNMFSLLALSGFGLLLFLADVSTNLDIFGCTLTVGGGVGILVWIIKLKKNSVRIILNSKGIQTSNTPFHTWNEVANEGVILEQPGQNLKLYYLVYDYANTRVKFPIAFLTVSPDELRHLLKVYRTRSKNNE